MVYFNYHTSVLGCYYGSYGGHGGQNFDDSRHDRYGDITAVEIRHGLLVDA